MTRVVRDRESSVRGAWPTFSHRAGPVPYRRIDRNDLWWSLRVAAVNLRRLLALGLTRQGKAWALA